MLIENPQYYNLAFKVGMYGLEMARPPASTKPMEVKLAHQETELVNLLKRLPLGAEEMAVIRDRATQLKDGAFKSKGESLLPLMLASFIFESLVLNNQVQSGGAAKKGNSAVPDIRSLYENPCDEQLGFDAAVATIGLKANISEAEHPLLCEGTRRQRGDLALMLLTHYKDFPCRIALVMEKLLDKELHRNFKSVIQPSFYASRNVTQQQIQQQQQVQQQAQLAQQQINAQQQAAILQAAVNNGAIPRTQRGASAAADRAHGECSVGSFKASFFLMSIFLDRRTAAAIPVPCSLDRERPRANGGAIPRSHHNRVSRPASDSGSSGNSSADSLESNLSLKADIISAFSKRPGGAPSGLHGGDSGGSSSASSSRGRDGLLGEGRLALAGPAPPPLGGAAAANALAVAAMNAAAPNNGQLGQQQQFQQHGASHRAQGLLGGRPGMPPLVAGNLKNPNGRYKGHKRAYPSLPNQPSEAMAHFLFELAKTVLNKAGGNANTAPLFTQVRTSA